MTPSLPDNERGKWSSAVLAALVHVLLGLFLFYGVRWQNRLPDAVEVELVSAPPPASRVAPPPPPAPPVESRPAPPPPPPEPDPEEAPAPPPRRRPDIAVKAPEPKKEAPKPVKEVIKPEPKRPEPKPEPKPEPRKPEPKKPEPKPEPKKPEPKPEPKKPESKPKTEAKPDTRAEQAKLDKAKADKEARDAKATAERARELEDRRMRELMARDTEHVKQSGEIQKELARLANDNAKASNSRALKAYVDKIAAKVKGNIVLPPGVSGDPFAVFYVDQLPDGTVIEVRLKRSTGNPQLDASIERAIQKSSPLPKPEKQELFQRTLNFEFHPLRD